MVKLTQEYIGVTLPFQKIKGKIITLGAHKMHMPGVMPGEIPGGYFLLLFPQQFGRVMEKGDLPSRLHTTCG